MKDSAGKTIYVGKAKNLQNRVRTYFAKNRDYKTQKLVEKIADIEFVVTDTEEEAFLLESNLIKRYRPHYNIELRDQQRYTYLRITDEKYPTTACCKTYKVWKINWENVRAVHTWYIKASNHRNAQKIIQGAHMQDTTKKSMP